MNTKRKLVALLAIATLISIVNASVFVYYPITLTISPQEPPVVFQKGSNAGRTDLRGETISVNIEDYGTRLKIQVHPTLQRNYYKDIAKIKNLDTSNTYYIKFNVVSSIAGNSGVNTAYLIVGNHKIDLRSSGVQPANEWIELSASEELTVDLYLELSSIGSSIEVSVDLIITTQTGETPPTTPP